MQSTAPTFLNRRLQLFVAISAVLIIGTYTFLSYWEYSKEFHSAPTEWSELLLGHGTAPAQYRIGVLFVAGFLTNSSHGHLAIRHSLEVIEFVFLVIGIPTTLFLVTRTRFYRTATHPTRCATQFLAILLLLFYLSWTFWFHKPETMANFASLAIAAALLSGHVRIPNSIAALSLILVSAYLGTTRADSGAALNLGILITALLSSGKALPLGRITQILTGAMGLVVVLGVEFYIKHVLYPLNPFSDPLFQLAKNLKSPMNLFCVIVAIAPYFLTLRLAAKHWSKLETWESAFITASVIEFTIFFIVAIADEVRVFMPYPMALLPTTAALLCHELLGECFEPMNSEPREA